MGLPIDLRGRELLKLVNRSAYERWLANEVNTVLNAAFQDVAGVLAGRYHDLTVAQRGRQAQLYSNIDRLLSGAYDDASAAFKKQLVSYIHLESEIAVDTLKARIAAAGGDVESIASGAFGLLTKAQAKAIAELPIAGLDLGTWWEKQAADMSLATRRAIQIGLVNGEATATITQRVLSSRDIGSTVLRTARRNATILVRTSLTTVENTAAYDTYKQAGKKVSGAYRYLATKDSRTTEICRALDGQVFEYDDPNKRLPPQHVQCRSTIVPEMNWRALGIKEPPKESPLGFKDFGDWLKTLGKGEQDSILGRGKAELWRNGDATLRDMVDSDNRVVSLRELRKKLLD